MMALSGVRISWLILARNSDLAVEAFSACLLGVDQLFLGALPGRDVAQHRAEFLAVADPPHGHVKRHQAALRTRPITSRPASSTPARVAPAGRDNRAPRAGFPARTGRRRRARRSRRPRSRTAPRRCGWPRARGRRGRAPDAVGRGVEDRLELAVFALQPAQRHSDLPRSSATALRADHQHQRVLVVPGRAEQAAFDRLLLAVDGGDGERLAAVPVRRRAARLGVDEQAVEPAGLAQRFERRDSRSSRGRRGWRRSAC